MSSLTYAIGDEAEILELARRLSAELAAERDVVLVDPDASGLLGIGSSQPKKSAESRNTNPTRKAIPADNQVLPPAQYTAIQTAPVRSAVPTNHSLRMNCFAVLSARQVDVVATGGGSDHCEEETADDRKADRDALLRSDDRVPREGERGEELEETFTEELAAGVRQEVPGHTEADAEEQVGRVGERGGHLRDEHVAGDATSDATEDRHQDDPDHGELLVVVRPAGQDRSVQRVRRTRR